MTIEILDSPVLEIVVNGKQKPEVVTSMHQQALLYTAGIDEDKSPCLLLNGERVTCTKGLKIFEDCALLQNVNLVKEDQGKSFGRRINSEIENYDQVKKSMNRMLSTADLWNIHRQRKVRIQRRFI